MAHFVQELAAIDARITQLVQSCATITQTITDLAGRQQASQALFDNVRQTYIDAPVGNQQQRQARDAIREDLTEARLDLNTATQLHDSQSITLREEQRTLDAARAHKASILASQANFAAATAAAAAAAGGAGNAPNANANQALGLPRFSDKDWSSAVYVQTKGAQIFANDHKWSESCNPRQVIMEAVSHIQSSWRNAPLTNSSYYDFAHGTPSNSSLKQGKLAAHLDAWCAQYQTDHPAEWECLNDAASGDAAGTGVNTTGSEQLFFSGRQRTVGKVFHTAFTDHIAALKPGLTTGLPGGAVNLPPIMPIHDEGNASCTPRTSVRLQEYGHIDESVCGVMMLLITPESGHTKPSFWDRCNDIYLATCTNGSKSFRMMQTICEYQPISHSVIARNQEDHFKQAYKENCALHIYFDRLYIQYAEFQREHGVDKPAQYSSFEALIWYEMCHCIRKNFLPEEAEHKNEYYRRLSEVGKVLADAYGNGVYDQAVIDAGSTAIKEHFNPAKGHQLILKYVTDIYTTVFTKGSWRPTPPLETWTLPRFTSDRFGSAPSKRSSVHFGVADELKGSDDEYFMEQCHYGAGAADDGYLQGYTLGDLVDQCHHFHELGCLDDDMAEHLNMALDNLDDDSISESDTHNVFVAAFKDGRSRFKMMAPGKLDPNSLSRSKAVRDRSAAVQQQQQQGSYGNPKSHTPSHGGRSAMGFRKAGFKGKQPFKRFQTRTDGKPAWNGRRDDSRRDGDGRKPWFSGFGGRRDDSGGRRNDRDNRNASMRDRLDGISRRFGGNDRNTSNNRQQPFVRSPPTPARQPGRQIFDRVNTANAKTKQLIAKYTSNPTLTRELKDILSEMSIYRGTEKLSAAKARESIHKGSVIEDSVIDALYALNENADDLTDAELEQQLFMLQGGDLGNDDEDDYDDQNYVTADTQWIDLETEDGTTHRLYFTCVDGQLRYIVDTGGSRDLCQNQSRFVPGSLKKLSKPIAIHMAQGAVYATHIGIIKYSVRAPDHYGLSDACFSWLSLGLYVPEMEADLAIMSVPSHQRLGVSLKAEGDDVMGELKSYTAQPYVYASGQTVLGHKGVTCRSLPENGDAFRGVETQSTPNSNMLLLQCVTEQEASQLKEIHLITGEPFDMRNALKLLRVCCPKLKGFASVQSHCALALDEAMIREDLLYVTGSPYPKSDNSVLSDSLAKSAVTDDTAPAIMDKYAKPTPVQNSSLEAAAWIFGDKHGMELPDKQRRGQARAQVSPEQVDVTLNVNDDNEPEPEPQQQSHGSSRIGSARTWLKQFLARGFAARKREPRIPKQPPAQQQPPRPSTAHFSNINYKLKVLMLCCGLASLMFGGWSRLRTEVVGLCEVNPVFYPYYRRYAPNATIYNDMRALKDGLDTGQIPWFQCDCIECSAPCTGRNSLRWHNQRQNDSSLDANNDLFLMVCDIARILAPSYVVCEMTPEHEYTGTEYRDLVAKMKSLNYTPHVMPRLNSCECGDATSRDRFFACFIHRSMPRHQHFDIDNYTGNGDGHSMTRFLDKPSSIPQHCWVTDRFITREGGDVVTSAPNSRVKFTAFPILRATSSNFSRAMARSYLSITDNFSRFQTYAVLLGNIFITSTLGGKVYSRHGPYVTITREARGMIFDDREDIYSGVRYPTVSELAKFSGFIGPQRKFLLSLPTEKEALTIIAGAITYNTSKTIWSAVCDHAFCDYEHNFFFAGKSLHSLDYNPVLDDADICLSLDDTLDRIYRSDSLEIPRQPKVNWTDSELARGFIDEDLTLADRVKALNADGYEYRHDLALDFRDKPTSRRRIDAMERTPYGVVATHDGTCVRTWRRADGTEYVEQGSWIEIPQQGHHPSKGTPTATDHDNANDSTPAKSPPSEPPHEPDKPTQDAAPAHSNARSKSTSIVNPFEHFPVKDTLDLAPQGRSHIPTSEYAPLPAANSEAGLKRAHAAWKLHNTLCPCSPETFENTIAISANLDGVRQGDSRIVKNCPKCLRFNNDSWRSGQRSKSDTRMYKRHAPGTAISIDGADAKTISKHGNYKIVLIVIDMGSLKTYTAYLRGDSSREFIEAMDNVRKQLHLETGNKLKYITSDAFSTYLEQTGVADWRDVNSIELAPNPADYKEWNAYAENRIRHIKRKARSALEELKGVEISGRIVSDPTSYWPHAWEHARQAANMSTHSTLEKWYGMPCSPDQVAAQNFTPRKVRLLPFGSVGYVHVEKKHRHHPLEPTNERCHFMFNAQYNLLVHKFANMYRGHVVLIADRGSLQSTGKVIWSHSTSLDQLARSSQKHLPGGGGIPQVDASVTDAAADSATQQNDDGAHMEPAHIDGAHIEPANFDRPSAFTPATSPRQQSPAPNATVGGATEGGASATSAPTPHRANRPRTWLDRLRQGRNSDDNLRQPRCNWTEDELRTGNFDKTISLDARIASLKSSGFAYNEVAASHWASRPDERERLDALPAKRLPSPSPNDINANLDGTADDTSPLTTTGDAPDDPRVDPPVVSPPTQPTAAPPESYIGRRCTRIFDGKVYDAVVLAKGVEKGTGRTLWRIRHTRDNDQEDLYTEELIPCLKHNDAAAALNNAPEGAAATGRLADIAPPDEMPSLSSLFKRNDVAIKLLKPDAKLPLRNGKPSKSYGRWSKYKHATTVGEYKALGGTSADFLNDFNPVKRYFTFADADLYRQHLKWCDDGGELPAIYVQQQVDKTLKKLYKHPAVVDTMLRLDANALLGLEGPNRLAGAAYKAMKSFGSNKQFLERNLYAGRPETIMLEEFRETVLWYGADQAIDSIELALYTQDDVLLDQAQIAALREIPAHQVPAMLEAIIKEIGGLLDLNTFDFISVDKVGQGTELLPTKLVLKVKTRADGSFDKNKARLVVQGFHQRIGKDFYSTFSPMASLTSVRMGLALAVKLDLDLIHMDVPQAFIRSFVDAEIYVKLPKGVSITMLDEAGERVPMERAGYVLRLLKSLYGIKQAPQLWNKELTRFLGTLGFSRFESESSIYIQRDKTDSNKWSLILAEVDDLIITSSHTSCITDLHKTFVKQWKVKDWEIISSFLGINMRYDKAAGVLAMDVKAKVDDFFKAHSTLSKLGSSNVPYVDAQVKAAYASPQRSLRSTELYMKEHFASIVGTLIYLSITVRPDITYSVNQMAKGMHCPELHHIVAMNQTLKYLNSHREYQLVYRRGSNQVDGLFRTLGGMDGALQSLISTGETPGDPLVLFGDSDFANDPKTRKSITGKATFLFGCLVSWQSKRQPTIATSTHEAEIIAMSLVAREGIWQRKLLTEMGIFAENELMVTKGRLNPTPLLSDNKASVFTANNPTTGERSKHIDVHDLKVREYVNSGELRVVHIRTDYNVSDFFTKGLTIQKYAIFRDYLMGEQTSSSFKGAKRPGPPPLPSGAGGG